MLERHQSAILGGVVIVSLAANCGGKNTIEYVQRGNDDADGEETFDGGASIDDDSAEEPNGNVTRTAASETPQREAPATGSAIYVKASNPDAQDSFGSSVAVAGRWLAVGAPNESSNATGINGNHLDNSDDRSGAAYLFHDAGDGWYQAAYIKSPRTQTVGGFAESVALTTRYLAIGAPRENGGGTGVNPEYVADVTGATGAVFVYSLSDDAPQFDAYVKASNTGSLDHFGYSVALSDERLVVGAPREDGSASTVNGQDDNVIENSGAAYVYVREENSWVQEAYVKASVPERHAEFGHALAIEGERLVVGAPNQSQALVVDGEQMDATPEVGAVYVFERSGSWKQTATLDAGNSRTRRGFGYSLSLDGDTLAVGAPFDSSCPGPVIVSTCVESGAVYIYEHEAGDWRQTVQLKPSDLRTEDWFGWSVSLLGDELVVGALGAGVRARYTGEIYKYLRVDGEWQLDSTTQSSNIDPGDRFGVSLALSPTLLAVGADGEAGADGGLWADPSDNGLPYSGAAYLFAR